MRALACFTSLVTMLRSCVLFLVCSYVAAKKSETWPFTIADKYVEEFKSMIDDLKASAEGSFNYQRAEFDVQVTEETLAQATKDAIEYDFIIVGGGTSGSVLASRLSEIPEWKILLLEAGPIESKPTRVPKNWEMLRNTKYNWGYSTTPQNYTCLAMHDHKCTIPSGRILGGTSAINSMVYTRGNQRDYDLWADLGPNLGWCWSDVLPYFKKIEDAEFEPFDKKFHHRGGLQHLEHPQYLTPVAEHTLLAAKELDIHTVDYNGKYQMGVNVPQLTTDCGQRHSAASAYLECTEKRPNLFIKPQSQVLKVLVSIHTKDAQGVLYINDGKIVVAKANKEVIVAAGAISTPKILLLSGIGPKEECDKHNINLVADLKVGHNLKIRPSFVGLDFVYHEHEEKHEHKEHDEMTEYLKLGKGPMTSPGIEALAFLKTNHSKDSIKYPDVELQVVSKVGPKYKDFHWMQLSQIHYDSIWKPLEGKPYVKIIVTLNHPLSQGIVKLNNSNFLKDPIIEPHFLSDEDEVDYHTILAGIETAIQLSHTEAFHKLGLKLNHNPVHGCEDTEFGSQAYWECAIKYLVVPTEDVSGTARMGPETDTEAVVDSHLKVHGVQKLRVADASVIPVSITGNLMGVSILIGEKAAQLIIKDWTHSH